MTFRSAISPVRPRGEGVARRSVSQVAFAGRSNAGKSSLLNALTGRSRLARVSNTPGRTRGIALFEVMGRFAFADLPGYGFAKVSMSEREAWKEPGRGVSLRLQAAAPGVHPGGPPPAVPARRTAGSRSTSPRIPCRTGGWGPRRTSSRRGNCPGALPVRGGAVAGRRRRGDMDLRADQGGDRSAQERREGGFPALKAEENSVYPVLETREIAANVFRQRILAPRIARKRKAGQFVVLRLGENGERVPLTIVDSDPAEGVGDGHLPGGRQVHRRARAARGRRRSTRTSSARSASPTHIEKFGTVVGVGGGDRRRAASPDRRAVKEAGNRVIDDHGRADEGPAHPRGRDAGRLRRASSSPRTTAPTARRGSSRTALQGMIDAGREDRPRASPSAPCR